VKVAEIFADLGIKLSGASKTDLDGFEQQLVNIANAAKQAALALAQLSKMQMPRGLRAAPASGGGGGGPTTIAVPVGRPPAPGTVDFIGPMRPPGYNGSTPPLLEPLPNAAMQGLKSLGMLALKIAGIGTIAIALKSLISTLGRWLRASMAATVSTELFTRQTGVNRQTMTQWEQAATKSGLAEGEAANAMKMLTQKRQQILTTGEGATPFYQLGVNAMAKPDEVFRQFQERTRHMSEAQAVYWGTLIGFSEDFAAFLHAQRGDLQTLNGQLLNDREQKSVVELNAAWVDLSNTLGRLRDKIVSDFAPALTQVLDVVTKASSVFTSAKEFRDAGRHLLTGDFFGLGRDIFGAMRSGSAGTTVENNVNVNIDGSGDPRATGKAAADAMRTEIDRMNASAYYQRYQLLGGPQPQP
jgi:hypothetical protein